MKKTMPFVLAAIAAAAFMLAEIKVRPLPPISRSFEPASTVAEMIYVDGEWTDWPVMPKDITHVDISDRQLF
ncbi:MAG: hypothetical protein HUJ54_12330 [Erysipelotrichaceae bacterium]|nr:hypothetical protein [Erysipelotrichaceae bacterium]